MRTRRTAKKKHRTHLGGKNAQIRFLRDKGVIDKMKARADRQTRELRRQNERDNVSGDGRGDR